MQTPQEDMRVWLKFASLCRKTNHVSLAQRVLCNLLEHDQKRQSPFLSVPDSKPTLFYAIMKYMWHTNEKAEAYRQMSNFVQTKGGISTDMAFNKLIARCEKKENFSSKKYFQKSARRKNGHLKAWARGIFFREW